MSKLTSAWQAALVAEHEAVFGYALLGPRLTGSQQQLAVACSNAHESLRGSTEVAMTRAGLTPVPPQADYPALYPVTDAAGARRLAARLEQTCASAWRFLYAQAAANRGHAADERRAEAQAALTASAVRATRWRLLIDPKDATTAFPGI